MISKCINVPYIPDEYWNRNNEFLKRLDSMFSRIKVEKGIDFRKLPNFLFLDGDDDLMKVLTISYTKLSGDHSDVTCTFSVNFMEDPDLDSYSIYLSDSIYHHFWYISKNIVNTDGCEALGDCANYIEKMYSYVIKEFT